jgi:2,5-diamino-6-(ribosylamino)-4(3H)-pyrimidinone 5'-phosphate reductase
MLPRVIIHNGVSVDGRMDFDWFKLDIGLYYELAGRLGAGAILSGSNTMLAAMSFEEMPADEGPETEPEPAAEESPAPDQLMVVVDGQGRLSNIHHIRRTPYWRDLVILCCRATPAGHLAYLEEQGIDTIVAGEDRVDLRAALAELARRFRVKVVRVDSGGRLNGALLRAGLVNEISLLISPTLVGGTSPRSVFIAPDLDSAEGVLDLHLVHVEALRGDSVWLRYEILRE